MSTFQIAASSASYYKVLTAKNNATIDVMRDDPETDEFFSSYSLRAQYNPNGS